MKYKVTVMVEVDGDEYDPDFKDDVKAALQLAIDLDDADDSELIFDTEELQEDF
jgi:hypothetical protein